MPKGTQRSFASAKASAVQWAEGWFKTLTPEKQANLRSKYSEASIPVQPAENRQKREASAEAELSASKKPRES